MEESTLKELLSKKAYQVELGPGGRNLSQIEMETIKNLNLPGISFSNLICSTNSKINPIIRKIEARNDKLGINKHKIFPKLFVLFAPLRLLMMIINKIK